jgi:hypothetical protein
VLLGGLHVGLELVGSDGAVDRVLVGAFLLFLDDF